jgi:glucosylceramidase
MHSLLTPLRFVAAIVLAAPSCLFAQVSAPAAPPAMQWISSTESQPWQEMPAPAITQGQSEDPTAMRMDPLTAYQQIDGFGGCFNELGWTALQAVSPDQRTEALTALFDPSGCNFTNCRMGIGANDFALAWYSFDETPDDFAMAHFSIDRDQTILIPYIKAAMKVQPSLKIWGVP